MLAYGRILLLSILFFFITDCSQEQPQQTTTKQPNLLLVTLDTVRADHTSVYGYFRKTTPTLELLATQGALLQKAYAPMATTGPSHASLLTGLYPRTLGVIKNGFVLEPKFSSLAEKLKDAGYLTAAIVSSFPLVKKFGFSRDFDIFDDDFSNGHSKVHLKTWEGLTVDQDFDRNGELTSKRAISWLKKRDKTKPFFLWVHYFDAHNPYEPEKEFASLFEDVPPDDLSQTIANYDREIRAVDSYLKMVMDQIEALNLNKNTLIVIVGDHGEGLMQHGWMEHGLQIYEEAVRVPLILRFPGRIKPALNLQDPVAMVDMLPTILELLAVPNSNPNSPGISFASALTGKTHLDTLRPIFLQRRHYAKTTEGPKGEETGIILQGWKHLEAPEENRFELYNLSSDPGETRNLFQTDSQKAQELSLLLKSWQKTYPTAAGAGSSKISSDDREKLKALGYVE